MAKYTGGASYKVGIVVEARPGFARVQFPDLDGLVSDWLPTTHHSTTANRDVRTLDVGNHVGVILDEHFEAGQVLGAIYSEADVAPVADPELIHHDFGGGASIELDRAGNTLRIVLGGLTVVIGEFGITINGGDVTVTGGDITTDGDVKADTISLKLHLHGGVQSGSGTTGLPQ